MFRGTAIQSKYLSLFRGAIVWEPFDVLRSAMIEQRRAVRIPFVYSGPTLCPLREHSSTTQGFQPIAVNSVTFVHGIDRFHEKFRSSSPPPERLPCENIKVGEKSIAAETLVLRCGEEGRNIYSENYNNKLY